MRLEEFHKSSASEHERSVEQYYDQATQDFYIKGWNPDHIHFGLFEPGECPEEGEPLAQSAGLARAVERMVDTTVAPARVRARHHVVDAGCGVAGTAMHLAKTYGCTITGINICRKQLDIAGTRVQDAGLGERVRLAYADCSRSLPFEDESVDAVVNIESACHYSDRRQFLREVARILKPGGRIVAMDWLARDGLTSDQYERLIQPVCDAWFLSGLESPSTYTDKVREAGLSLVEFAGFNGADRDNLRLIENAHKLLTMIWFSGKATDSNRRLMDQFHTLYVAWRDGYFELGRYCAVKPEGS